MKIYRNYVLIEAKKENNRRKSGIYIDTDYNKGQHANVVGKVLAVPQSLDFCGHEIEDIREKYDYRVPDFMRPYLMELNSRTLEYETDMELKVGDTVIFFFKAIQEAVAGGLMLEKEKFLISYDRIYVAVRGQEIIPVNGTVLLEPVDRKFSNIIHVVADDPHEKHVGVIRYLGKPLKGYYQYKDLKDTDDLKVGQKVLFNPKHRKYLETSMWANLPMLYCMKQKEIYGISNDV